VKAVHLIEQEAHMADLTQKVEAFLTQPNQANQPDQPNSGE
jgi:hypothetical protein